MQRQYESVGEIILTIDGLQPEKGHETLYVVREPTQKRVWFAEALISATTDQVQQLIAKAKEWAESLGKTVVLWISDKQDAFVKGIAAEFPDVPHRYCDNHFLRDVAKPVLEADSHAKVQMRRKVRGLRKIEQAVLKRQSVQASENLAADNPEATLTVLVGPANAPAPEADSASAVVLEYCAAVRGILNGDQGGPLHPPGLRMAEALNEVRESIQRNLDEKKGASKRSNSAGWPVASTEVWTQSRPSKRKSENTSRISRRSLRPSSRERRIAQDRQKKFQELSQEFKQTDDPIRQHMAQVMISFLVGLFVGQNKFEEFKDNLDLERWFRLPKSHERRIHGHRHAGVRIVQEGPTLVHALDAHMVHPGPFTVDDLLAYRTARSRRAKNSAEPPQDHEESTIQKATANPASGFGTAISRNVELLAWCCFVDL